MSLLVRTAALGLAAGSRSTLAVAGPTLASDAGRVRKAGALIPVIGELVGDKLPTTPSRLEGPGLYVRAGAGAVGGLLLARGRHESLPGTVTGLVAGAFGGVVGAYVGVAWRESAVKSGRPSVAAALIEDGVAVALTAWACRR